VRKRQVKQIIHHFFVDKHYVTLNKTLSFKGTVCAEQQIGLECFVRSASAFLTATVVR
jgi:hypothetical protein